MVKTQAQTISLATAQRTEENLFAAPTPIMDVEIMWVVLTGECSMVAVKITAAALVSAAKPLTGAKRAIFMPMVLIILQPPKEVPKAMAKAQVTFTQRGT